MNSSHKYGLVAFAICAFLFFLSGAPLQRGWGLWTSGLVTTIVVLSAMALGYGVGKKGGPE